MEPLTGDRLEIQAWQRVPARMAQLGLSDEDGMTQVWFVSAENELSGGAAAANNVLALVWWLRPLSWLYRLPLIRPLEDAAYRWVAKNRYKMPSSTPSCKIDTNGASKKK